MAAHKFTTPITMLVGLIFCGSLLWLLLGMITRAVSQFVRILGF